MAPPTVTYNNSDAKYTRYEQTTSASVTGTELAIAKAMLTRDIDVFNNNAPNTTRSINTNYKDAIGYGNGSNIMFNHQQNDLGTVFAIAAQHNVDGNNRLTNGSAHTSFIANCGTINGSSNTTVAVTNDSAAYYDSELRLTTDNTENIFYQVGSNGSIDSSSGTSRFSAQFGLESNFNAQKAVNSIYSTTDSKHPLQIVEDQTWNTTNSLFTERVVGLTGTQVGVTGTQLTSSAGVTGVTGTFKYGPFSTLTNSTSQTYYSGTTGVIGIDSAIASSTSNDRVFFGTVKGVVDTENNSVGLTGTAILNPGPTGSTLALVPVNPGSDLPSTMTLSDFKYMIDGVIGGATGWNYIYDDYSYGVTGVAGGGYTFGSGSTVNPGGLSIDDSRLLRNSTYMRACSTEGSNFANTVHSIEVVNGFMSQVTENSTQNGENLFIVSEPSDVSETLGLTGSQSPFIVDTYYTSPSLGVSGMANGTDKYYRASVSGNTGAFSGYTDFEVIYDKDVEGGNTVLGASGRSNYYDRFVISTVVPSSSTSAAGVAGSDFSGDNYIGNNNGFAAVIQDGKSGINTKADYTFTSSAAAAGLAGNDVVLLKLTNNNILAQENTFYVNPGDSSGVAGTSFTARGSGFSLSSLNNAVDLRMKLDAKTGLSSTLTDGWTYGRKTGSGSTLITDLSKPNMFGNAIYPITSSTSNQITLSFFVGTNETATNYDALNYYVDASWFSTVSSTTYSDTYRIEQDKLTFSGTSTTTDSTDLATITDSNLRNSPNLIIKSLIQSCRLVKYTETRSNQSVSFNLPFGPYSNLEVTSGLITVVTTYYGLVRNSDGSKLPDGYLIYVKDSTGANIVATRNISGNAVSGQPAGQPLTAADLYGFTATVQKNTGTTASPTWENVGSSINFDPAFNNISTFTVGTGSIIAGADITVTGTPIVLNQPTYYVELSTANGTSSYTLDATRYNITADGSALETFFNNNTVISNSKPTGGAAIANLSVNVSFTSPAGSGSNTMSLQPNVTITVTDGTNIWAQLVTSNDNATSDFNIWYSKNPVFKIVEQWGATSYNDNTITTYKLGTTSTTLQVVDGVKLTYNAKVASRSGRTFTLLGDRISALPWNDSTNPYAGAYSNISEVTPSTGLVIGTANKSRMLTLKYYRGNSVNTTGVAGVTQDQATFERFQWNRTPTKIYMRVFNAANRIYTSGQRDIFNGSTYVVSDLSGATGIIDNSSKGNIGLIINSSISRYQSSLLSALTTANRIPVNVSFGSYNWRIENPNVPNVVGAPSYVTPGSGTISASNYRIIPYLGTEVVASRVKVYANESFQIKYNIPPLVLYYSPTYITSGVTNGPVFLSDYEATPFQTITHKNLVSGTRQFIIVPGTQSTTPKDSIISIRRPNIKVDDHIGYFTCAPPQFKITAVATNVVTALPYNYTSITKTDRYFNLYSNLNNIQYGRNPFNNVGNVNNMTIVANPNELYTQKRLSANTAVVNMYVPSNKITIDMYLGYPTDESRSVTTSNRIVRVYNGYIHDFAATSTYVDTGLTPNKTTYYAGGVSNGKYNLSFTQDASIFSSSASSSASNSDMYGLLGDQIYNIELSGFYPFINIVPQHLDLLTGDSVNLVLYGHNYEYVNNKLVANIIKYSTAIGFDFSSAAAQFLMKNLAFTATKKEVAQVDIRDATASTLNATPFNFITDVETKANSLSSLSWSLDNTFTTTTLNFNITSLTPSGQGILTSFLGASNRSPYRCLVCSFPPILDIRSADGSPIYMVNKFGTIFNVRTHTTVVELNSVSMDNTEYIPYEYITYNSLRGNAV